MAASCNSPTIVNRYDNIKIRCVGKVVKINFSNQPSIPNECSHKHVMKSFMATRLSDFSIRRNFFFHHTFNYNQSWVRWRFIIKLRKKIHGKFKIQIYCHSEDFFLSFVIITKSAWILWSREFLPSVKTWVDSKIFTFFSWEDSKRGGVKF